MDFMPELLRPSTVGDPESDDEKMEILPKPKNRRTHRRKHRQTSESTMILRPQLLHPLSVDEHNTDQEIETVHQKTSIVKKNIPRTRLNSKTFIEVIGKPIVKCCLDEKWEVKDFLLVHDNAGYFACNNTQKWCHKVYKKYKRNSIKILWEDPGSLTSVGRTGGYPPWSPDFMPTEHVHAILKQKVHLQIYKMYMDGQTASNAVIKNIVKKCYTAISQDQIRHCVLNAWNNVIDCIEAEGGYGPRVTGVPINKIKKNN